MAYTKRPPTKRRTFKRKTAVSKAVKTFVKKTIQKEDRCIVSDTFNPVNIPLPITMATANSFLVSSVRPFTGLTGANKSDRVGNDIKLTKFWHKFIVQVPGGGSNVLRFTLVRFPNSAKADMAPNDILQHNASGQAVISPYQDNHPYQILMDKTVTVNNSDGTGAKTYIVTLSKDFRKRPQRIEYTDDSTTGAVLETQKGLLRLFYYQQDNSVGIGCTITRNCSRYCYVDTGNSD